MSRFPPWALAAVLASSTTGCANAGYVAKGDGGTTRLPDGRVVGPDGTLEAAAPPCACFAEGLVCGADGGCEPCKSNSQCAVGDAGTPACELESKDSGLYGHCVACTTDVKCPSGQVCDVLGVDNAAGTGSTRLPNLCYPDCRQTPDACTPGVSFCQPDSGLCGFGCLTTANACAPVGQQCDTEAGVCVQCLSPSDCPINQPGCFANHCGNCVTNSNCPLGQTCDPTVGLCHCSANSECELPAPACAANVLRTQDGSYELGCGCVKDAGACPSGTLCNPGVGPNLGGECLPSCLHDGGPNCAAQGMVCVEDSGICGKCKTNTDCHDNSNGTICIVDGGTAGNCTCIPGESSTCPSGTVCNPPEGCTRKCTLDGGHCSSGTCDEATGICHACTKSSDCAKNPLGTYCDTGDGGTFTCGCQSPKNCLDAGGGCSATLHRCGICDTAQDCPITSLGCNMLTASCGSCSTSADCPDASPNCSDAGACGK